MNTESIEDLIKENKDTYEEAGNSSSPEDVVNNAAEILKKAKSGPLVDLVNKIKSLFEMIRAYIKKEYKEVPLRTIIAATFALSYVFSPVDVIPDYLPGGLLDDAAVVKMVVGSISEDIEDFEEWQKANGKAA